MSIIFWALPKFNILLPCSPTYCFYFCGFIDLNVFKLFLWIGVNSGFFLFDQTITVELVIEIAGFSLEIEKVIMDFTWHNFLGKNVVHFGCSTWIHAANTPAGFSLCLMYSFTSQANCSEFNVAELLNSWPTVSSVLGTETPLICRWILTTANISWYIISHWAATFFYLVLPMIPLALFCDLLMVCSGTCQLQSHWTFQQWSLCWPF